MTSAKLVFVLALMLLVYNTNSAKPEDVYSDGMSPPTTCTNCSICQYPCRSQPPPPAGYLGYGAPPPPAAPQVNCPPAAPAQCCQNTPPMPYNYYPYGNYSACSPQPSTIYPVLLLLLPLVLV